MGIKRSVAFLDAVLLGGLGDGVLSAAHVGHGEYADDVVAARPHLLVNLRSELRLPDDGNAQLFLED